MLNLDVHLIKNPRYEEVDVGIGFTMTRKVKKLRKGKISVDGTVIEFAKDDDAQLVYADINEVVQGRWAALDWEERESLRDAARTDRAQYMAMLIAMVQSEAQMAKRFADKNHRAFAGLAPHLEEKAYLAQLNWARGELAAEIAAADAGVGLDLNLSENVHLEHEAVNLGIFAASHAYAQHRTAVARESVLQASLFALGLKVDGMLSRVNAGMVDVVTLFHGTSSNRASKIIGNELCNAGGFRSEAFLAEDFATAEHFAVASLRDYLPGQTPPKSFTVLAFRVPRELADNLGLLNR